MNEFKYECTQSIPIFAILSTTTEWAVFRAIFQLRYNKRTIGVPQRDEGWATVETVRDWDDKVKGQVAGQSSQENNGTFLRRLVVQIQYHVGG